MKNKKQKGSIVKWVIFGILVAATVVITIFNTKLFGIVATSQKEGVEPFFYQFRSVSDNAVLKYLVSDLPTNLLRSIQIIGYAVIVAVALHYLALVSFHNKRAVTISKLLVNFLKWMIGFVTLFFVLDAWGADTRTMLISAGVVTLIIGLGSQSLVADILAGIFIVFEGEYQVGDIVIVDGWRGTVQQIGIRTTRLIDAGGNIKIVNNSEIKSIVNQTKELSLAKVYFPVDYETPVEKVEAIVADGLERVKERIPAIVEGPFYKGITEFGTSNINYLFVAKCDENDIYQVQRDLNRELRILFFNAGADISYERYVIEQAKEKEKVVVTKKEVKKAEAFIEEQKELSKDMEDLNDK